MTTPEPTGENTDTNDPANDDVLTTPATPGAEALPTESDEGSDSE